MSDPAAREDAGTAARGKAAARAADTATSLGLDRVLPEADFRPRLSTDARNLFRLERLLAAADEPGDLSRRFCLRAAEEAQHVEYALLEVGARDNRRYAFFAEAVHALRWAAKALHALHHLRGRIRRYLGDRRDLDAFRRDLDAAVTWLSGRVEALFAALREEAVGALGLELPAEAPDAASLDGEDVRWRLPQDLDVAESHDERDRIAETANAFLALSDEAAALCVPQDLDAALEAATHGELGPARVHAMRVRLHAIQSTYDAAVAGTPLEAQLAGLKTFRGYVSILLHLMEAVAYMLEMHARLAPDDDVSPARRRAAALIDDRELLRWALRFGMVNAQACFAEARPVVRALLDSSTRVREATFALPPGRKLHLRPAGLIVRVVQKHGLPVEMRMGPQTVDARMLMDVILLAAGNPDETTVTFRGDERPLRDLELLFGHGLGEEGLDRLPPSLAYLVDPSRRC
jgi:phosphotransferase system HPr-like phosphotransfer protein